MFEQYLVISSLVMMTRIVWTVGQRVDIDRFISYMHEDPEAYRLWDHVLLRFHRRPFSIITLQTMSFALCMMLSYLLIVPTGINGLVFVVGVLACSSNFSVRHSIQYPLLALMVLTSNPIFLIPLILTKELAAWLGLGYLLLTGGLQPLTVICASAAFLAYVAMRLLVGERVRGPEGAPLFAVPYHIRYLLGQIEGRARGQILWNLAGVAVMIVFSATRGLPLLLWTAVPVLLFAMWWEPQLWLPTVIVLLAGG